MGKIICNRCVNQVFKWADDLFYYQCLKGHWKADIGVTKKRLDKLSLEYYESFGYSTHKNCKDFKSINKGV